MRVLLDECFPWTVGRCIEGHVVRRVEDEGWKGRKNGALLRAAVERFDVLLTTDTNLEHQQQIPSSLAVVCVDAGSNRVQVLMPLVPQIQTAISSAPPGRVTTIRP